MLNLPQPRELRAIYEAMDSGTRSRGQERVIARILRARAGSARACWSSKIYIGPTQRFWCTWRG
jgi:hypothetical protein